MPDFSGGDGPALMGEALAQVGLYSIRDRAWQHWISLPPNEFRQGEFNLWLREQPEYKVIFPYAAKLREQGIPFTEAAAIQWGVQARQELHRIGVPAEMITKEYIDGMIGANLGFNEFQQRVIGGLAEYMESPAEVKQAFQEQLGDDSAVIGFYLDANQTMQRFNEIKAGALTRGYAKRFGIDVNFDKASQYAYGMTAEQIKGGLAQADQFGALSRGTVGDPTAYGADSLVEDVFSQRSSRIEREVEERSAQFADASSGYQSGALTGFGSARGA